jgi:hypothetical protein
MPPVNPQGSRGGLVAAVVVFTVLFVVATIFAIYYGVQESKAQDTISSLTTKYRQIAVDINSSAVSQLRDEAQSDARLPEPTALAEAIQQRDDLRQMIVGMAPASTTQPIDASTQQDVKTVLALAQKAVAAANGVAGEGGSKFSAGNLLQAVTNLTNIIDGLKQAVATAQTARDAALQQGAKDALAARQAQDAADAGIAAAKKQLQQQLEAANQAVQQAQQTAQAVKQTFANGQQASNASLEAADQQQTQLSNQITLLNKQIDALRDKLSGRRLNVEEAIVRRPEGQIVALSGDKTVYINLGRGDQIVPGMTFEVYDKSLPLPKLGNGLSDQNLPVGKASIEVTRVLSDSSECYVDQLTPGKQIVQGDRILNLIYSRNVKFKFFVYGNFDIAHSGHATPQGTNVIKRLVVQWGGSLDSKLDAQTDFVVIGMPPSVPAFSAEELKDPLNEQALANARYAFDQYENIVKEAEDLHVPILNQDKFLYFTGYYDLALQ